MILKSYIVEQNVEMLGKYQASLIYGQNNGIKADINDKLKDQIKNSEIIIFFEEEILRNKNILYENIINESLFNEKKIIFILNASDKIFDQVSKCLERKNDNIKIYIFAEILEKRSKLRNLFEKDNKLAIFACYQENHQTLVAYINKELKEFKGLSGEVVNYIISNSNMDRGVIKNELIKIKSLFLEKKIKKKEILELLNITNHTNLDKLRDNMLGGEKRETNKLLSQVDLTNEETYFYLSNLNYRVNKLIEIITTTEGNKEKYEQTIDQIKPPIFWKDKPFVIQQLRKWSLKGLTKLATKIGTTEALMKKNSYLRNDVVIKDLVVNLVNKASSTYS